MEALRNKLITDKIKNIAISLLSDDSIIAEANLFLEKPFDDLEDTTWVSKSKFIRVNNIGFNIGLRIDRDFLKEGNDEEITYYLRILNYNNKFNSYLFKLLDAWEQGDNSSKLSNEMKRTLEEHFITMDTDNIINLMLLPICKNCNVHYKKEIGDLCHNCLNMNEKLLSDLLNGKSVTNTCVCFDETDDDMLNSCMKCNYIMHETCRSKLNNKLKCPNCKSTVNKFYEDSFKLLPEVAQMIKESNEPKQEEPKRVIKKIGKRVVKPQNN